MKKEENQFKILLEILKVFNSAGVLQDMMLIGSWCLYFYRLEFEKILPTIRTLDVDFLIPAPRRFKKETDVPRLLKEMGFVPTFNHSSGLVVYDHEELRVEFLVPEMGRGYDRPHEIKNLHVKAVALRYLNLLVSYPKTVSYQRLHFKVPEPAVFALHKLIISARRLNKEKARKDLEMAVGLLDILFTKPSGVTRIKAILSHIPKSWLAAILAISQKHFPKLNLTAKEL